MVFQHLPSITLSPQIEALRLDLRVQLGKPSEESLQDFPCSLGSEIGGIFDLISWKVLFVVSSYLPIKEALITG